MKSLAILLLPLTLITTLHIQTAGATTIQFEVPIDTPFRENKHYDDAGYTVSASNQFQAWLIPFAFSGWFRDQIIPAENFGPPTDSTFLALNAPDLPLEMKRSDDMPF